MTVRVEYVDGTVIEAPLADWPTLPADGVWSVTYSNKPGEFLRHAGHSVYWCYPEGDRYVVGLGTVSNVYGTLPSEAVLFPDGHQEEREIKFMPDLRHDQIKLGWWR